MHAKTTCRYYIDYVYQPEILFLSFNLQCPWKHTAKVVVLKDSSGVIIHIAQGSNDNITKQGYTFLTYCFRSGMVNAFFNSLLGSHAVIFTGI